MISTSHSLELRGVAKSFGQLKILSNVELSIFEGEKHALIGPNGAGKSTLFNLISGRLSASAGEITLHGERIDGLPPEQITRRGLGRSFQITSVFARLSAFENVRVAAMRQQGVSLGSLKPLDSHEGANARAQQLLDLVRLTSRADIPAGELSYSDQRALEIAITLATDPKVILLDEPTAGMSRSEAEHVVDLIRETTQGRTLLIVEHDMDVVFRLCDRISVLVYGRIIATGKPEEIQSNNAVREAYLGSAA